MDSIVITNVRAMEPGEGVIADWVQFCNGKIAALGARDALPRDAAQTVDGGGRLLTPGLIDVHTHGIERFAYDAGPDDLVEASRRLAQFGTTCVLPTLYHKLSREGLDGLRRLAAAMSTVTDVCMPGLHLEGPFLGLTGAGCDTVPGDVALLEAFHAATGGKIAAISISPEVPNILPVIRRMHELGIVPFITHTQATLDQAIEAIDAGARHATHFYDVFPLPAETDPGVRPAGVVEAILADPRCSADFIADGVHVNPTIIRAVLAAKGFRNVMLITDSNVGAGLPPGVHNTPMGDIVTDKAARLHRPGSADDGGLAGSTLTMNRGMANLLAWIDLPEEQIWAMGTSNPARLLGLPNKGTLRVGGDADIVLWDQSQGSLSAVRTWVGGRSVFQRQ